MKTLLLIALCLVVSCSEVLGSPDSKPEQDMYLKRSCENMPLAISEAIMENTFKKDGSVDLSSVSTELDKALGKDKAGKERRLMQMLVRRLLQGEHRTAKDVKRDTISDVEMVMCTSRDLIDFGKQGIGMFDVKCKKSQSELENGSVDTRALIYEIDNLVKENVKDWKSTYNFFEPIEEFVNSFSNPRCGSFFIMDVLKAERPGDYQLSSL